MKLLFFLFIGLLIMSCSGNKITYWCGDHPCINKKEKEAYFKETMIVEIKELNKKDLTDYSEIEKIMQQAQNKEKSRIKEEKVIAKQAKLEEKRRIKQAKLEEKRRIKQAKLKEKRRIKEEKVLAKQAKSEEKRRIKEEKILAKQVKKDEKKIIKRHKKTFKRNDIVEADLENITIVSTNFQNIVEKVNKKNILRPYPDINDIPN